VCKELSTWWQRAGHTGRRLSVDAIAILLVEPCFFDDEKEKLVQKVAAKATKNIVAGQKLTAEGQLQLVSGPERVRLPHRPHLQLYSR